MMDLDRKAALVLEQYVALTGKTENQVINDLFSKLPPAPPRTASDEAYYAAEDPEQRAREYGAVLSELILKHLMFM